MLGMLPDPAALFLESGVRPKREGNRNPNLTPAETFPTRDGLITIVLMNTDQYERFCRVLGDDTLRTDAKFATNASRLAHYREFRARVEAALATATTAEWSARFAQGAIAAGPVYEFDEVFEDPQVKHLGLVVSVDQPGQGTVRMLGFPARASATPAAIRRPAPRVGEHTAEILTELGMTAADVERLAAAGAVAMQGSA
jgi:crotonobetainyl-CoA:carnitine CoA-transferase CaiB-like acyl-CoA transferase